MIKTIKYIIIIAFLSSQLHSQSQDFIMIEGKVMSTRNEIISNAHIINLTQKRGTTSDEEGLFRLVAASKDSILISSVGYKPMRTIVPDEIINKIYIVNVKLIPDTITLQEAIIRKYPATYELFKKEFVKLDIDERNLVDDFKKIDQKLYNPSGGIFLPGPFTILYNLFSKEMKSKKKLVKLQNKDKIRNSLYQKFPKQDIIKQYNLKDEAQLIDFLEFCRIPQSLVDGGSLYEIVVYINDRYAIYITK